MLRAQNLIGNYYKLSPKKRIDLIYKNYKSFPAYIDDYEADLAELISEVKAQARRNALGDLGVRIQTGAILMDPVGNMATDNIEIEKCLETEDFASILKSLEDADDVMRGMAELHLMRYEYDKLNRIMKRLRDDEYEIFIAYITRKKRLSEISEELCIEMESANTRIYRIRKKVFNLIKDSMDCYDDESILGRCS